MAAADPGGEGARSRCRVHCRHGGHGGSRGAWACRRRLSRPDDPLLALLRESENGVERVLTLVNPEDREPRQAAVEELLTAADLGYLGDRLALAEMQPDGAEQPVAPRFAVAPLEVK